MVFPLIPRLLTGLVMSFALSSCTLSKQGTGTFVAFPEEQGQVVLNVPAYLEAVPQRVQFLSRRENEEYVLYRSQHGQAEILFATVSNEQSHTTVLEFYKLVADAVRKFRFNQGQNLVFGKSFDTATRISDFWVQPYKQASSGRNCLGFTARWDFQPSDKEYRPRRILFGYHCATKGIEISAEDAAAFVKGIDIRGITMPLKGLSAYNIEKPDVPAVTQKENLVVAQDGGGGGVAGLPEFPLLIHRVYEQIDGGNCTNC